MLEDCYWSLTVGPSAHSDDVTEKLVIPNIVFRLLIAVWVMCY